MISIEKAASLLGFRLIVIAFTILLIAIPFITIFQGTKIFVPWWAFIIISFIGALFYDLLLTQYKAAKNIRNQAMAYKPQGAIGTIAAQYKYVELGNVIIISLIFVLTFAITGLILYVGYIQGKITPKIQFRLETYASIATYVTYLLFRPILAKIGKNISRTASKSLPFYKIYQRGITIDFRILALFRKPPEPVKITFSELEEIRVFNSFQEAEAFYNYSIGPDVKKFFDASVAMLKYASNSKMRPKVFFQLSSFGTPILLKGKNLFYLISFENPNPSDLLRAFKQYKK